MMAQNVFKGFNSLKPQAGPRVIPYRVDLTNAIAVTADWQNLFGVPEAGGIITNFGPYGSSVDFDLFAELQANGMQFIQSVYIDNSYNPGVLLLYNPTTRQQVNVPPYSQGFFPIVAVADYKFHLVFVDRTGQFQTRGYVDLLFLDVPMPVGAWNTRNEKTARWEDFSGTITTGGSFQLIGATNAFARGIFVQNPLSALEPLYLNPVAASTVSATTAQSIALAPGQWYEDKAEPCIWRSWRISAATTGHAFTCWEIVS
jgi:hypothetical protein